MAEPRATAAQKNRWGTLWFFAVTSVILILLVGLAGFIWTHAFTAPAASAASATEETCSPISWEPCTAREALVKLAAGVEAGEKNLHPKVEKRIEELDVYSAQIVEANTVKAKAEAEMDKAKWEQDRYREMQRELHRSEPATTSTSGGISCDRDAATREVCDRLSR